ncbi:MAG: prephenate/arogenate dehydrogenase family protein [Pseudomonadota bacterium]
MTREDTTHASPMFEKMALIGLGLIGSSLSHAARRAGLVGTVTGAARSPETRKTALKIGIVDEVFEDPAEAVRGADLVIVCVPVGACGAIAEKIAANLQAGAIVSDVGSVKAAIVRDMAPHLPETIDFVPGHPIAGTEQSGPESGFAELFENRWCILTPPPKTQPDAVNKLTAFWKALGSDVEVMTPEHHDMVLAITSHLPHLMAFNIVNTAAHLERVTDKEVIKFSAGGFRDFTRIAASDPVMWRDVFLNNREAVLEMLGRFSEDLTALQRAIRFGDADELQDTFAKARQLRRGIIEAGQDTSEPDFGRRPGPNSDPNSASE